MARARVIVDKRRKQISIVFEPNAADGTEITDRLQKWCSLKSNILVAFVENRCAVIRCYVSKEAGFILSKVLKSAAVEIHSQDSRDGFTYSSATCCSFSVEDLTGLASTMEFELAQIWIEIPADDHSDEHSTMHYEQDSEKFFEIIERVVLGDTEEIDDIECIGNVADGYKIIWLNPRKAEVERVVETVREWCKAFGIELIIVD